MVSYREALRLLLQIVPPAEIERCRIEHAGGRVLGESVVTDRPFPAFDRVMMDGYALRLADWESGCRTFRVTGSAPAGKPAAALSEGAATCLEVMTGAQLPSGADGVVPVEEVAGDRDGNVTFFESAAPVAGRYIHRAGSDAAAGEIVLLEGRLLGAREIGVAASCGAATLGVSVRPRLAVLATGDELVAVDAVPLPHQIRQSNGHSLAAALKRAGYPAGHVGCIGDEVLTARPAVEALLATHNWLVLTGAVSMGARDFVPTLLDDLGCRKVFHGVAHRPGKPAGCWVGPASQVILALPGNPVSALTGLHVFLIPALAAAAGAAVNGGRRVVMDDLSLQLADFTQHLPVTLGADGRATATTAGNSGDFIGLLRSEGFVTLPPRGAQDRAFSFTPWL